MHVAHHVHPGLQASFFLQRALLSAGHRTLVRSSTHHPRLEQLCGAVVRRAIERALQVALCVRNLEVGRVSSEGLTRQQSCGVSRAFPSSNRRVWASLAGETAAAVPSAASAATGNLWLEALTQRSCGKLHAPALHAVVSAAGAARAGAKAHSAATSKAAAVHMVLD